jgi:hypothetical protein
MVRSAASRAEVPLEQNGIELLWQHVEGQSAVQDEGLLAIGDLCATFALAMGVEASVRRTCATQTSKRLVLVELPPMRTGPSELANNITEEWLTEFFGHVEDCMRNARSAPGRAGWGALAKYEGNEPDELMAEVERACVDLFGDITDQTAQTYVRIAKARRETAEHAQRAVQFAEQNNPFGAAAEMLTAQWCLVDALTGGDIVLCTEARQLRNAQLAEIVRGLEVG